MSWFITHSLSRRGIYSTSRDPLTLDLHKNGSNHKMSEEDDRKNEKPQETESEILTTPCTADLAGTPFFKPTGKNKIHLVIWKRYRYHYYNCIDIYQHCHAIDHTPTFMGGVTYTHTSIQGCLPNTHSLTIPFINPRARRGGLLQLVCVCVCVCVCVSVCLSKDFLTTRSSYDRKT